MRDVGTGFWLLRSLDKEQSRWTPLFPISIVLFKVLPIAYALHVDGQETSQSTELELGKFSMMARGYRVPFAMSDCCATVRPPISSTRPLALQLSPSAAMCFLQSLLFLHTMKSLAPIGSLITEPSPVRRHGLDLFTCRSTFESA